MTKINVGDYLILKDVIGGYNPNVSQRIISSVEDGYIYYDRYHFDDTVVRDRLPIYMATRDFNILSKKKIIFDKELEKL